MYSGTVKQPNDAAVAGAAGLAIAEQTYFSVGAISGTAAIASSLVPWLWGYLGYRTMGVVDEASEGVAKVAKVSARVAEDIILETGEATVMATRGLSELFETALWLIKVTMWIVAAAHGARALNSIGLLSMCWSGVAAAWRHLLKRFNSTLGYPGEGPTKELPAVAKARDKGKWHAHS
jgi:hypothetical protein